MCTRSIHPVCRLSVLTAHNLLLSCVTQELIRTILLDQHKYHSVLSKCQWVLEIHWLKNGGGRLHREAICICNSMVCCAIWDELHE